MKFLIMGYSRIPSYLVPLRLEHIFRYTILKHPQSLNQRDPVSYPYKTRGNIVVLFVLILYLWKQNSKTKVLDQVATDIPRERSAS